MRLAILLVLFLFTLVLPFSGKAQDSIELSAHLQKATVFFSGAELTRKAATDLEKGRNVIVFKGLSPHIEAKSVQIQGGEGLRIRSVEKDMRTRRAEGDLAKRISSKKDSLDDTEFKLSLRKSMRRVYQEEKNMILENKNIKGEQTGTDIEDLMELAVYYRKRLKDIEYKLIEVKNDIEALNEERNKLQKRIRKLKQKGKEKATDIIVAVEAESKGLEELTLSYFSPYAGWVPAYELNCPSLSEAVRVTYKGEVWQRTERDWSGVDLTLASGRPTKSGDQPELDPWQLQFRTQSRASYSKRSSQKQYPSKKEKSAAQKQQQETFGKKKMGAAVADRRGSDATPDPVPQTQKGTAVHTRFQIESAYDIPSGRSRRSVTIKKLKIDAEHDHLAVPKLEQEAFLIAKLSGWEATDLFPGQASVQYAGRYVGQTRIDPNITEDTLEVSLGRDKGVVVEREKVEDKTSSQIIGGKKVLEMGIDIRLKNKRNESIALRVKDQLPLSGRGDVEVSLTKSSGAEHDKDSGALRWRLNLKPGVNKVLHFAYTIKYPKELNPVGL